ncbi:cytochrome P450 [Dendryphion nanum]|uniref:Cytochrome P450 n=1 Tax=Dendryphion nanum TaxID=256645 RepID=A0A9P9D4I8_9PLEO|nr:cytochrome P450 [Dendryphion nanum]
MDELFAFVHDLAFRCAVESFFGESMFKLNPDHQTEFLAFEDNVPFLASVKKWRKKAVRNSANLPESDTATWESVWGLQALRRRNKLFEATEGLFDEEATAATDLATIWAFTSNVIPASFWFLFEIFRLNQLLDRARADIGISKETTGSIDPTKVVHTPFLQSVYAEALRLHSASLITRSPKQEHKVDEWIIPKDQAVVISTHVEHRSSYWNTVDPITGTHHPPSSFYAERFLVWDENENDQFSTGGTQGLWMPYGMGEHMCPGRHIAKYKLMLVFAVLVDIFDIELITPPGWAPDDDHKRYRFGTLRPKQKVSFRVRKRVTPL